MKINSIPASTVAANRRIVRGMSTASDVTASALQAFRSGHTIEARDKVAAALAGVHQARESLGKLNDTTNLLDGTAHRFAMHSERELGIVHDRLELYAGKNMHPDSVKVVEQMLFDAANSTRLAKEAGTRSLKPLKLQPREHGGSTWTWNSPYSNDTGPSVGWSDGEYLDALGNPVRGYDRYAGPDDAGYDLFTGEGRMPMGDTGPDAVDDGSI